MSDDTPRYIIAQHNSEPAPPEYMYYSGISHSTSKGTADIALQSCGKEQVLWDDDRRSAKKLHTMDAAVSAYISLENLGFENLRLFEITLNYGPVDILEFKGLVTEARVREIISKLDEKDAEYLERIGVLDLTIVT